MIQVSEQDLSTLPSKTQCRLTTTHVGKEPISIIIPNYNGKDLLANNLPSVLNSISIHNLNDEIIIVDNGSSDNSLQFLSNNYPSVKIIELKHNMGFGYACNIGVSHCRNRIFILLNNDVWVTPNFIPPLLSHFKNPNVFSVSSFDMNESKNKQIPEKMYYILYASGGFSAFDKTKFLKLEGFHPIYTPFYFEDRDIGYRAWKRNWQNILEPKSIVYHTGEQTAQIFTTAFVNKIKCRNAVVFFLSCYTDITLIITSILSRLNNALWSFKWTSFASIFWILRNRSTISKKKRRETGYCRYTDRQVFKVIAALNNKKT